MKKGEKAVFTIRSDYAYGAEGSGDKIPGTHVGRGFNLHLSANILCVELRETGPPDHRGALLYGFVRLR